MSKKFKPSATGSIADLKADVKISKVHGGYFSNSQNAKEFIRIGVKPIKNELPQKINYADYGGGDGFLTKHIDEYLKKEHQIKTIVLDANKKYLMVAKKYGLKTKLCNLESCSLEKVGLITMRAVNHYNTLRKQQKILKNAFSALERGGYLISQISSGTEKNCRLRSDIVNLKSLGRSPGNYYWTTIKEYKSLLKKAGFKKIKLLGFAPNCQWKPEGQWNRFNKKTDIQKKKKFIKEANALIEKYASDFKKHGIYKKKENQYIIKYQYPIISAKK